MLSFVALYVEPESLLLSGRLQPRILVHQAIAQPSYSGQALQHQHNMSLEFHFDNSFYRDLH